MFKFFYRYIPLILLLFAVYDLRTELKILLDHLTIISIIYTIKHHPLAIATLIFMPSLIQKYKS